MNRKPLIILLSCLLLSIALIAVLYALSDNMIHKHNSFLRIFPPHIMERDQMLDIKYNSYYIAGSSDETIYLGNYGAPLHLLVTNTMLSDTQHVWLTIENVDQLRYKKLEVQVDSPYFYLIDGVAPFLLRGKVDDWHADHFMYDSAYFVDAVAIGPTSFVTRSLHSELREYELAKETDYPPYFEFKPDLLEKQIDGIFCTDGVLQYNKDLKKLIYLYYYRNQYLVMDTSLNLVYKGNTIDTNSIAKINVTDISSNSTKTMSSPPLQVNKKSCTYGNWLFVNSALLAKNENLERFQRSSVIDVYDLTNGEYKFSFYLKEWDKKKVKAFRVMGNTLIALYEQHLVSYKLDPERFASPKTIEASM